jgi:hypothetical protein
VKDHERDALFARARGEATPTDDDRRRVRAALRHKLGIAAGASVGLTAAKAAASVSPNVAVAGSAAAKSAVAGLSGLTMIKVAAIMVGLAAVGVTVLPRHSSVPASKSAVTAVLPPQPMAPAAHEPASPLGASAPPVRDPSTVTPAIEPAPRPREVVASRPLPAPATQIAVEVPPAPMTVPIADLPAAPDAAEDLALIKEMQAALRVKDSARVLTLVREHERRFPRSPLAQERDGARVLATCAGATPADAAKIGETFLEAYPLSPVAARVRVTCSVR